MMSWCAYCGLFLRKKFKLLHNTCFVFLFRYMAWHGVYCVLYKHYQQQRDSPTVDYGMVNSTVHPLTAALFVFSSALLSYLLNMFSFHYTFHVVQHIIMDYGVAAQVHWYILFLVKSIYWYPSADEVVPDIVSCHSHLLHALLPSSSSSSSCTVIVLVHLNVCFVWAECTKIKLINSRILRPALFKLNYFPFLFTRKNSFIISVGWLADVVVILRSYFVSSVFLQTKVITRWFYINILQRATSG